MQSPIEHIMYRIWERRVPFVAVFFVAVLLTYAVLFIIDFIPEPVEDVVEAELNVVVEEVETEPEPATGVLSGVAADPLPTRIIFDTLDKEVAVLNPTSNLVEDLDAALLSGAVRHPDSADFSEPGNIFILAHSSYLPNVMNKNFQAFNRIQELTWGDTIRVQSGDREYTYFIEDVYQAKASEVTVPMTPGEARLTLATCNSFGSKDDRFIVEARLESERAL